MIEVSRVVAAPPERVLEVLADGWSYVAWVVGTTRIRSVDEHWPEPGSRIGHAVGAWPFQLNDSTRSLDWDREGGRIRLRARGWPLGEAEIELRTAPHPRGCVVTMLEDVARGPGRLVPRAARQVALGARNRETLGRLAALAERRVPDRSDERG